MRKILHFDSPREQYLCDASVVSCFDNRFEAVNRKLLKHIGVIQPDPIRIAGGAKSLASPDEEFYRTFVIDQIRKSMRLHNTTRTLLILHSDCGAYNGLAGGFGGDTVAEFAHHRSELRLATSFLKNSIPELLVQSFFLNFEGAWIIEEQASTVSDEYGIPDAHRWSAG